MDHFYRIQLTLICTFSLVAASAQIPNGGFEQWVDEGNYVDPVGWLTYNDAVPAATVVFVEPGGPGPVGNFHAVITSRDVPGGGMPIQGWASAGSSGSNAGFPYSARPAMLTGQWQYGVQPNDTAQIEIALINSASQTWIAHGTLKVTGDLDAWQLFEVPFTYFSSEVPDTAYIQISASIDFTAPVAGSFIKIDDLAFVGGTVGIAGSAALPQVSVFPIPASDRLTITSDTSGELRLLDATGRTILTKRLTGKTLDLDVSAFSPGLYFYQISDGRSVMASGRWLKH